jgi:citrate synthase
VSLGNSASHYRSPRLKLDGAVEATRSSFARRPLGVESRFLRHPREGVMLRLEGSPVKVAVSETPGIPVWETAISALEPQLVYRGYPAAELAESSQFLDTAYLLIHGEMPVDEQLADWQALLHEALHLPTSLVGWLRRVPTTADTTDVLQAVLAREPLREHARVPDDQLSLADQFPYWLGRVTALTAGRRRIAKGLDPIEPRDDLGFAANLWWLLREEEAPAWLEQALETLLIICADHGLAPATLAVRLAASTGSNFSSALQAGIAVARGPHAAGAAAEALGVLSAVRTAERADAWVKGTLERHDRVPGFRHRAYRVGDPRTECLTAVCRRVAERTGHLEREKLAGVVEHAVWQQAQVLPALSWPVSRLLDNLGIEHDLFVPLYVISRLAGWTAHFAERLSDASLPFVRPKYVGEPLRHHRPLSESSE